MQQFTNGFKSFDRGRYTTFNCCDMLCRMSQLGKNMKKINATIPEGGRGMFDVELGHSTELKSFMNDKAKTGECVSTMTYANARGLAKLAAYMANKGTLNGHQLMSE